MVFVSGTKTWYDAGHDGHGRQTQGSYGAVATALTTRENTPSMVRGWLCLLRDACAWTWRRMSVNCLKRWRIQSMLHHNYAMEMGWMVLCLRCKHSLVPWVGLSFFTVKTLLCIGNGCFPLLLLLKESSSCVNMFSMEQKSMFPLDFPRLCDIYIFSVICWFLENPCLPIGASGPDIKTN